eukprot:jgi/Bigna1/72493/fgenesh1_pg.20_\
MYAFLGFLGPRIEQLLIIQWFPCPSAAQAERDMQHARKELRRRQFEVDRRQGYMKRHHKEGVLQLDKPDFNDSQMYGEIRLLRLSIIFGFPMAACRLKEAFAEILMCYRGKWARISPMIFHISGEIVRVKAVKNTCRIDDICFNEQSKINENYMKTRSIQSSMRSQNIVSNAKTYSFKGDAAVTQGGNRFFGADEQDEVSRRETALLQKRVRNAPKLDTHDRLMRAFFFVLRDVCIKPPGAAWMECTINTKGGGGGGDKCVLARIDPHFHCHCSLFGSPPIKDQTERKRRCRVRAPYSSYFRRRFVSSLSTRSLHP